MHHSLVTTDLQQSYYFNYSLCSRQHGGYNLCSSISKLYSSYFLPWCAIVGVRLDSRYRLKCHFGQVFIFRSICLHGGSLQCDQRANTNHLQQSSCCRLSRITDGFEIISKLGPVFESRCWPCRRLVSLTLMDKQARLELELIEKHEGMDLWQLHLSDHCLAERVTDWTCGPIPAR